MSTPQITITISVTDEGFYCNASDAHGSFVCTTVQPNLDMSLASAMPFIRDYAASASGKGLDLPIVSPACESDPTGIDAYIDGGNAAGDFREPDGKKAAPYEGMCVECGKNPQAPGYWTCRACNAFYIEALNFPELSQGANENGIAFVLAGEDLALVYFFRGN